MTAKMHSFTFDDNNDKKLEIQSHTGVFTIRRSEGNNVDIKIDGTDAQIENYDIKKEGSSIIISQKSNTFTNGVSIGNGVFIANGVVIGNGACIGGIVTNSFNTSYSSYSGSNGRYFNSVVNGVYYDHNGNPQSQPQQIIEKPISFEITLPYDMHFNLDLSGQAKIISNITYKTLELDLSGASKAEFIGGGNSNVDLSGATKGGINDIIGSFTCSCSGSSSITSSGEFSFLKLKSSGASKINTRGTCSGDYNAKASGASSIKHSGVINGRVTKNKSGAASIKI